MTLTEDSIRRIVAEELAKHRTDILTAAGSSSVAAAAEAAAAAAQAAAAAATAASMIASGPNAAKESAGAGAGPSKSSLQGKPQGLSLNVPNTSGTTPVVDEDVIKSSLYRQFGLVLGELQAGDEQGAIARIRSNLRALSAISNKPEGWAGLSRLVDDYTAQGKTESDPLTPSGGFGGIDRSMMSAAHAAVLFPSSAGQMGD
eukprot:CAMPEP_0117674218 /NCGR_PEP_ID=MMETSP0804-20121206/14911_1 /TAXON_ID=1074897 /ORGANISM="Tetraselmis astigmatica, Strain CCMP880" /LENGTH=201 /DNA_ID=CAMNT_0005483053 /DNA_START=72 /DNA_END=677 /DNA_ORIENTATION=+